MVCNIKNTVAQMEPKNPNLCYFLKNHKMCSKAKFDAWEVQIIDMSDLNIILKTKH